MSALLDEDYDQMDKVKSFLESRVKNAGDNLFLWTKDIEVMIGWVHCNPYNLQAEKINEILKKSSDTILKGIEMDEEMIEEAQKTPFYRDLPKTGEHRNRFAV